MINVIIAKPTRECNADCSYCSSPPEGAPRWTIETFKTIFDRLSDNLADTIEIIWHGGEPMMMGPDFYREAYVYAKSIKKDVRFAIQTNLLLYKSSTWRDVFYEVFKGAVSTSFEPDNHNRTIKGNADKYTSRFHKVIEEVIGDGFYPLVISTFTQQTIHYAQDMYELMKKHDNGSDSTGLDLRVNYVTPTGRYTDDGISPESYGQALIDLYDQWIVDAPGFNVVPLSEMLGTTIGVSNNKCPWTNKCGGRFLSIEPNGDLYNCSEFADIGDKSFSYGNVIKDKLYGTKKEVINGFERIPDKDRGYGVQIMETPAARHHIRREHNLPMDCRTCDHFKECEGGCHRDSVLLDKGMGGKFFFCRSWKMVFARIKESILSGEAENLLKRFHISSDDAIKYVENNENRDSLTYVQKNTHIIGRW
jgi:uncharacterized protein